MTVFDPLQNALQKRHNMDLYRSRTPLGSPQGRQVVIEARAYLNFCSNDYLGLANHPELVAAVQQGVARWGVGSGASHLVCGHFLPHQTFEYRFAKWVGKPAALLFSSGYMANLAVINCLVGRGDAIFSDKLNHASLNDAARLSRAQIHRYPHCDLLVLERMLEQSTAPRKLIITDTIFSMDGNCAPIPELLALAERFGAWLYLDDAHGFGVLGDGKGILAEFNIDSPRILYMATLGKAAGVSGAVVAAEKIVIDWLVNTAGTYIYTTAFPPFLAHALLVSLDLIQAAHQQRLKLIHHIATFRETIPEWFNLTTSQTPIQPLIVKNNLSAVALSSHCAEKGIWVCAIRPPTVPTPRLRVTLSAAHTDEDVNTLLEVLSVLRVNSFTDVTE